MPLNVHENEEQGFQEKPKADPILHTPSEKNRFGSRIIGILFVVIVLAAIGFLLYTYGLFGGRRGRSIDTFEEQTQRADQAGQQAGGSATTTPNADGRTTVSHNGRYTLYIGSYRTRTDAEEEVGRWKEAGYEAFVRDYDGWFRVALGHFDHVTEARNLAEGLNESFEQGYWIGPI